MATDRTVTVSGRVPKPVAEALAADAKQLGTTPGRIVRQMLEGRYSLPANGGKSRRVAEDSSLRPNLKDIGDDY